MKTRSLRTLALSLLALLPNMDLASARGFGGGGGGFHGGGGMGGGGYRGMGGGMPMGGMNRMGGGMPMGGMGGMNRMGGGMPMGGMNRMGGGMPMGGMNRMGGGMGNLGERGMGNFGGANAGSFGAAMGGRMGEAGRGGFPNAGRPGFGNAAEGGMGAAGRPNEGQLGHFLGLPSEGGMHGLAGGAGALRTPAAAGAMRTSGGEGVAARRAQEGNFGGGIARDGRGLGAYGARDLAARGDLVRDDFRRGDFYSAGWFGRYPGAWFPGRWAYGGYWAAADWGMMCGWYGWGTNAMMSYDYGNNVVYQDNSVYINGQNAGTAEQYYSEVQQQASSGTSAPIDDAKDEWMPLGVFAMSHDQQTKANLVLQLAINRDGIVRGNYTATMADHNLPVHGSLDKKSQRVAWTIGDNAERVFEAGLYDLTKDEVPLLVHFDKDRTEQWQLIRVSDKSGGSDDASQPGASDSKK